MGVTKISGRLRVFVVFMGDSVPHEWNEEKHKAQQNVWQAKT